MNWSLDRRLQFRMALTLLGLAVLTVVFATAIAYGLALMFDWLGALFALEWYRSTRLVLGGVTTVLASGWVLYRALGTDATETFGAMHCPPDRAPELHASVQRLAHRADIPAPSIHVTDRERPLAITTGLSAAGTKLVVSTGLLEILDENELEAVVAHEIAHIKNRDATVMTVVELPLASARKLGEILPRSGNWMGIVAGICSYVVWGAGRILVASLARSRELAADRGASALLSDPAPLASALQRLDDDVPAAPDRDAREVALASMSIVPNGENTPGPDVTYSGGRPAFWRLRAPVRKVLRRVNERTIHPLLKTHPATTDRIERLRSLDRRQRNQ